MTHRHKHSARSTAEDRERADAGANDTGAADATDGAGTGRDGMAADVTPPNETHTGDPTGTQPPGGASRSTGGSATGGTSASSAEAAASGSEVERQLADQRDRYLRLAAEYDNFRRRSQRERSEAESRGQADLVKQLIDGLDDLSRFAHVDPATTEATTIVQGVDMVERKLLKVLGAAGLQVVNPIDQTFDPALHEAVATEPALSAEDDHVVSRVYQHGYVFNGQLLRPARVVVKQWNG